MACEQLATSCRPHAPQLGTPFAITLEAPHVVDMRRQVWAGVVGTGPGGATLNVSGRQALPVAATRSAPAPAAAFASVIAQGLPERGTHKQPALMPSRCPCR